MSTFKISKDRILEVSKKIISENGIESLNMRSIALKCGVALGSIYNYFPTKFDLMIAVVEDNWNKIFYPALSKVDFTKGFIEVVEDIYNLVQNNHDNYLFFHSSLVDKKDHKKGRKAMEEYFGQIHKLLISTLAKDKNIKQNVWNSDFTKEQFAKFIFMNMVGQLSRRENNLEYLKQLIKRIIY